MLKRLNPEIALGFLLATILWIGVLGWSLSYAPTEIEKQVCQEAARNAGHKTEECKTLWERTTSDPVAFFTFVLSVSTIALFGSTIALWAVTKMSAKISERALFNLERPYVFVVDPVFIRTAKEIYTDLAVANCGKIIGNLYESNAQFSSEESLPSTPPYGKATKIDATCMPIGMITKEKMESRVRLGRFVTPDKNAKWFLGYFLYDGLIEKGHKTWFCYRLPEGNGVGVVDGGSAYNGYT